MGIILCGACNRELRQKDFYIRHGKILRPCKHCKKKYYNEWKSKNPTYHEKWRSENPEKIQGYKSAIKSEKEAKASASSALPPEEPQEPE